MTQEVETEPKQQRVPREDPDNVRDAERPPVERRSAFGGHPLRMLIVLLAVAAAVVGGVRYWMYLSTFEDTDDAQVDGYIYPVSPRVNGRVTAVLVQNNQPVTAGQTLVQLDQTDYQIAVERARADYNQSQADARAAQSQVPVTTINTSSQISTAGASVEEASVAISVAQQQYEAAQARIREAQANAVKAHKDVERYRPLVEKREISQQQFDQATATAQALDASVDTAKASADAALRQIAQAKAHLQQAQAQASSTRSSPQQIDAERARAASMEAAIGVQKATLDQALLNVKYTTIAAPVDGVVGQRNVEVGQQVQPGQALFSVIPLSDLWITANFKETQLKNMRVGQRVEIHVDATNRDYRGHVDSFPGATGARYSLLPPENATGNFVKVVQRLPVKILLEPGEDKEHLLRPGMSCEPKVLFK